MADLIAGGTSGQVAGFIAEAIQGVGGATPLADGYLSEAYKVTSVDRWQPGSGSPPHTAVVHVVPMPAMSMIGQ